MALFAPIPRARVMMAIKLKPGDSAESERRSERQSQFRYLVNRYVDPIHESRFAMPLSLITKRNHRIDFHGATGGQDRREQRCRAEQDNDCGKSRQIRCPNSEE